VTKLGRGYNVESIQDKGVFFATQLLAANLLRKCQHNQVPASVISLASQCAEGVVYNWETFLLNAFVEDCKEAQDQGHPFHYSWLLILIAMEAWREPKGVQFPQLNSAECHAVRYHNLVHNQNADRQHITNAVFSAYFRQIFLEIQGSD